MDELDKGQLLTILQTLDVDRFKAVVGMEATDDQILEAMHLARSEHGGISWKKRKESLKWLEIFGTQQEMNNV
jgi:hypothetical protein